MRLTDHEVRILSERYPHERAADVAAHLGMTVTQVYHYARKMGLRKSEVFRRSDKSGRIKRGRTDPRMIATQFKPGHKSWNKGRHFDVGGRSADTRFKKGCMSGQAQHNYVPIGSTRIVNGNLEKKTTDDPALYPARRWQPVHRMVWEGAHGQVPRGHVVVFRPGMHTSIEADITLNRLECISRQELMRRNNIKRYPPELRKVMRLKGRVTRQLNKRGQP